MLHNLCQAMTPEESAFLASNKMPKQARHLQASGSEATSYFPCEEWLDAEHGTQRILMPVASDPGHQKASYLVTLHTASGENSGTSAYVTVTLKGKSRQSGPHELQPLPGQHAKLQPGQVHSPECWSACLSFCEHGFMIA